MDLIIILTAFFASCLTFFSGFGLGTILMPVFLFFFPLETAIALTAVVHLLNNVLKVLILWKNAHWDIVCRFGLPAFVMAFFGARILFLLEKSPALYVYTVGERDHQITLVKVIIAVLIVFFVLLELSPILKKVQFPQKFLPLGGLLSGFLGGLSGHQGALRSMFLLKCGLAKESYIATGVIIACFVDVSRIAVYWTSLQKSNYQDYSLLMILTVLSAFAGVLIGSRMMKKVTMQTVQLIVSGMLLMIALLLGSGMI